MSLFKNKYRIVADRYAGYEVQIKRWWLPIWLQVGFVNTHITAERAERFAKAHAQGVVTLLGELP